MDCPRKFEFSYVELIRPDRQADALRFGSAYHYCQEELDAGTPWKNICAEVARRCVTEIETQQVLRLVAEHRRHYDDTFIVEATEQKYATDIGGVACEGKLDRLIRLADGRLALQEYKTSSEDISPGSIYWRRLRVDIQVGMYLHASGADCVVYDVCRKPSIRQRQKESVTEYGERLTDDIRARPEFYFQRQEINRLASDADDTVADVQAVASLISLQQFPRNTAACTRFGTCCYFQLCSNGHRPSDGAPAGFHVVNTAHQELQDAAKETR
jgi:hypothetical protein